MSGHRVVQNAPGALALVAKKQHQEAQESLQRVLQSITDAALEGKTQVQMAGCFADAAALLRERGFGVTVFTSESEKYMDVAWAPPGDTQ